LPSVCSTGKLIKSKKQKLSSLNTNCEKKQQHLSQNILHVDALYNIRRKKYKTVCAELAFAKVTFDRMVMILLIELAMFSLFAMQLDYRNSHCLYAHKLYLNAWKLFQKCKKLQIVHHIHTVFKFWGIFSTF
jgi:hypothetical protein